MAKSTRNAIAILSMAFTQAAVACVVERNPSPQVVASSDSSRNASGSARQSVGDELSNAAPAPAHLCRPATYAIATVRDTSDYENDNGGGRVGRLYLGNVFIDSVDIDFGVHSVGHDSLIFLPVVGDDINDHVLYDGVSCLKLTTKLPYLDSYFSSPSVAKNALRYWGLNKLSESGYAIYAIRLWPIASGFASTRYVGFAHRLSFLLRRTN